MTLLVTTTNPATGERLSQYVSFTPDQVEQALADTRRAHEEWAGWSVQDRCAVLRRAGELLTQRRQELAELITAEMGKPITEALGEIDKCAWDCEVAADGAPAWLADVEVPSAAQKSWLSYQPLGVVLAVMPWNFPFWQVIRFAGAALPAGNAALLKHSPNVTGCALALEQLFADAGAPAGLFRTLVIAEEEVPTVVPQVIADPRVNAVTVTGSERAGAAVASAAGTALKKSVLELGGSDPFVVLDDADLPVAADAAVKSRFGNAGQSCIAAKRFIVADSVADEFGRLLAERVALLQVGDPTESDTTMGPMARPDLRDGLHAQVQAALAAGAILVTGGAPIDGPGCYYEPTILDVQPGTPTMVEEVFGPVASVVRARDDDHAVELANDTTFGLGAAVWSSSDRGLAVGRRIHSGALFINAVVASDPRLPFGGIGRSGYGRELAAEGTREFTNVRTVFVGVSGAPLPTIAE